MNSPPLGRNQSWRNRIDSRIGSLVAGRYRLYEVLATGGIGAVYAAEDEGTRQRVALKLLFPETEGFAILAARMDREGLIGQRLRHPNVVRALDFGTIDDGCNYLVTELIPGRTLRDVMKDGPLPLERALSLMRQLLDALRACHALDVLHRDLKPRNIIVDDRDHLTLLDFGLARVPAQLIGDEATDRDSIDDLSTQQQLTTNGIVFGTLAYMAPETALGMSAVDERSDLYAAGVMFYELLTGQHPFAVTDPMELFLHHRVIAPPPFCERAPEVRVPPAIEAVVMRLLAKRPIERFGTTAEVITALRSATDTPVTAAQVRETLRTTSSLQNATVISVAPTSRSMQSSSGDPAPRDSTERVARVKQRRAQQARVAIALVIAMLAALAWLGMRDQRSAAAPPLPQLQSRGPFEVKGPAPVVSTAWPARDSVRLRFRNHVEQSRWQGAAVALKDLLDMQRPGIDKATLADHSPLAEPADRERAQRVALRAAYGDLPGVEELFDALAERGGPGGLDALYAIVESHGESRAATLAWERLRRPHVRSRLSPPLASALSLREASCKKKPELFERAGADGDERTLRALQLLRPPRCDARRGECCLWKHEGLESAVDAIEERQADP